MHKFTVAGFTWASEWKSGFPTPSRALVSAFLGPSRDGQTSRFSFYSMKTSLWPQKSGLYSCCHLFMWIALSSASGTWEKTSGSCHCKRGLPSGIPALLLAPLLALHEACQIGKGHDSNVEGHPKIQCECMQYCSGRPQLPGDQDGETNVQPRLTHPMGQGEGEGGRGKRSHPTFHLKG